MEECRAYPEAAKIGNKQEKKKPSLRKLEMYM